MTLSGLDKNTGVQELACRLSSLSKQKFPYTVHGKADKKEQAWQYYTRILDDKPNAQDFLNAGHVAFAMGHIKKALELYLASIENDGGNAERFAQSFEQDTPDLLHAGIPADEIPILYDQVLYQANEKKGTNA